MTDQTNDRTSAPDIAPAPGIRVVRAWGAVIAETARARLSTLPGAEEPEVWFPRDDAGLTFLDATQTTEDRPGLGRVRLYDIMAMNGAIRGAAWAMESPAPGAEDLDGHVAFDESRVTVERL